MNTYEAVFILDDRQFEDGGEAFAKGVVDKIKSLGGKERKKESWGRKQTPRPLKKKHTSGIFWNFTFDLPASQVEALKNEYRLQDSVLRVTVFRYDKKLSPELQEA